MATTSFPAEPVPFSTDDSGAIRVASSRITLDIVAAVFQQGATPEQIVDQFPSLKLDDVYAVATWMLRHPDELRNYLAERRLEADELRKRIESLAPPDGFRARLAARRLNGV